MSVSTLLLNGLNSNKLLAVVIMVLSLSLAGCGGAGGETSDPAAQAPSETGGGNEEGGEIGGTDPEPEEETAVLNLVSQPSNAAITEGQSHTFSVTVEHDQPISVTWYLNDAVVQNSSSTSLSASSAGTYDCSITDGLQTVSCDSFTLAVNIEQFVTITEQPSNQFVSEGVDVTLSVTAVGTGVLSYQWYFDGELISGANNASLVIDSVQVEDGGSYHIIVSNSGVSTSSSTATLNVAANSTGSALISWDRPQSRADDSDLAESEIQAYEVYYSGSAGGEMTQIDSVDAVDLAYTATGLDGGVHYFSLATVDTSGLRSELSAPVAVTIN